MNGKKVWKEKNLTVLYTIFQTFQGREEEFFLKF